MLCLGCNKFTFGCQQLTMWILHEISGKPHLPFGGPFKLQTGYLSFFFRPELDLMTSFHIDHFCSRPRLGVNFEIRWMISWIFSGLLQKPFIIVICMIVTTIRMKITSIAHLRSAIRLWCWECGGVGCWLWKKWNGGQVSLRKIFFFP